MMILWDMRHQLPRTRVQGRLRVATQPRVACKQPGAPLPSPRPCAQCQRFHCVGVAEQGASLAPATAMN